LLPGICFQGCAGSSERESQQAEIEQLRREVQELRERVAKSEATERRQPADQKSKIKSLLQTLKDGEIFAQYRAGRKLEKMGPEATPALLDALGSDDSSFRRAVLLILVRIADKRSAAPLMHIAQTSSSDTEKGMALIGLGRIANPEAQEIILQALEDESKEVKVAAIRALRDMESQEAIGKLVELLTDKDSMVRAEAKRGLKHICRHAFPGITALYGASDTQTKVHLIDLLSELNNNDAEQGLFLALEDDNLALQLMAARTLAEHGNFTGVALARDHLNSKNPQASQMAMQILKRAGYEVKLNGDSGQFVITKSQTETR